MKPEQLYQHLLELAEKLGIIVKEQNLRTTPGVRVKSGLCRVKDEQFFIMDKHKKIRDKVALLADCLGSMSTEDVYVVPAVRDILDQYTPKKTS